MSAFIVNLTLHNSGMTKLSNLSQRKLLGQHEFAYTETYKAIYVLRDLIFIRGLMGDTSVLQEITKFEVWHALQMRRVKSFLIRWVYAIRSRNKYYNKNMNRIIKSQAYVRGWSIRKLIRLQDILVHKRFQSKALYATKIQKAFRSHIFRKRRSLAFNNVRYVDKEIDEMVDFDDDFFNGPIDLDYDLKIPDGVDIGQLFKAGMQVQTTQQQTTQQQTTQQTIKPIQKQKSEEMRTSKCCSEQPVKQTKVQSYSSSIGTKHNE